MTTTMPRSLGTTPAACRRPAHGGISGVHVFGDTPCEYIVFPDEGHGFVKKDNEIRGYGAILTFLDQHLKGQKTLARDSAKGMPVPVGTDSARKTEKR